MSLTADLDKLSDPIGSMSMASFAPRAELADVVRCFAVIETTTGMTRALLPDTTIALAFRFGGSAVLREEGRERPMAPSVISGLRKSARHMRTSAGGRVIVARIIEGRIGRFHASPHALFGRTVPLEDVFDADAVARTSAAIGGASDDAERARLFEEFLLVMARPWTPDSNVVRALDAIEASRGTMRIDELARRVALSQDAFEKRFRRAVGATPKAYASIVRFHHAMAASKTGASLTEVSVAAGYADQSHFNRQFRHVTGASPRSFLASGKYC